MDEPKRVDLSALSRHGISVTHHVMANLGDHGEFVTQVVEVNEGWTIRQLVNLLLEKRTTYQRIDFADSLTIQLVRRYPDDEEGI